MEKDLNSLIRCLEIYLGDCIEKIDIQKSKNICQISGQIDNVLSFNYTNTFEKLYGNDVEKKRIHYIHGKVDLDRNITENNMILGIDEYLDKDKKDIELNFVRFKKYFQRIYKKTGSEYMAWIKQICSCSNKSQNKIYFFGHSLDVTDKDILSHFFDIEKFMNGYPNQVKIKVFYYDKKALSQQIVNLVRIIGQDSLVKKVNDGRIEFLEQKKMKNRINYIEDLYIIAIG